MVIVKMSSTRVNHLFCVYIERKTDGYAVMIPYVFSRIKYIRLILGGFLLHFPRTSRVSARDQARLSAPATNYKPIGPQSVGLENRCYFLLLRGERCDSTNSYDYALLHERRAFIRFFFSMSEFLFTSESVSEGHPDKVADQVSDAIVDAILAQDPRARVAAETLVNTGLCVLAGEITTTANIDYIGIARKTIVDIGYDSSEIGYDGNTLAVLVAYDKQSPDIAQGVNEGEGLHLDQGAGDQGLMFGYATNETDTLMPSAIHYAHRLMERQAYVRKSGIIDWLRPDAKSQVTFRYVDGKPVEIDTIVISTQHAPEVEHATITE